MSSIEKAVERLRGQVIREAGRKRRRSPCRDTS